MNMADETTTVAVVSDDTHDATPDGVPQCTAITIRSGRRCQNPAILDTGFCHGHLDFSKLPATDEPAEGEDGRRLAADNSEIREMRSTTSPGRNRRKDGSLKKNPTGGVANSGESRP